MTTAANQIGRSTVVPLTNKSGGLVAKGDLVYLSDGSTSDSFTTGTTGAYTGGIGIVLDTSIANNAVGLVVIGGYVPLVNVNASVTINHYGKSHTVAKQATDAGASRVAGTFVQFLTGGTTPDGVIWQTDLGAGTGTVTTASNYLSGDVSMTTANTFYDGPSLATTGVNLLIGHILCSHGSISDFTAKLWDGTTVISSTQLRNSSAGATLPIPLVTNGIVTASATYKISVTANNNTGTIRAAAQINGAGNTGSYLLAYKVN